MMILLLYCRRILLLKRCTDVHHKSQSLRNIRDFMLYSCALVGGADMLQIDIP